jgi:hypothetical protein
MRYPPVQICAGGTAKAVSLPRQLLNPLRSSGIAQMRFS